MLRLVAAEVELEVAHRSSSLARPGAVAGSGQELADLVKQDIPRFRKLVTEIGIQPE